MQTCGTIGQVVQEKDSNWVIAEGQRRTVVTSKQSIDSLERRYVNAYRCLIWENP